jgi:hypothetical protein
MRETLARAFLWIAKWLHKEEEEDEEEPELRDAPFDPRDQSSPKIKEFPAGPEPIRGNDREWNGLYL